MHDIKAIRDDPEWFDQALARRGIEPQSATILALDEQARGAITRATALRSEIGQLSAAVAFAKRKGEDASISIELSRVKGEQIRDLEQTEDQLREALREALSSVPNLPLPTVRDGLDESQNYELRRWGSPRTGRTPPHEEIATAMGLLDAPTAVAMSGQRFTMLYGALARLERVLGGFMVEHNADHGFVEVSPPLIVHDEALYGTGQLQKFQDDLYGVVSGQADAFLIPTAEVSLTNIVRNQIIDLEAPRRYTALTPCFRAEAGAAGRDSSGLIRQHQFYKAELVSICRPQEGETEFVSMLKTAESLLQTLGLPYRVMALCCGDMGFSACKTFDLEVWLPSQQRYREISSISMCGDFQARRMKARYWDERGRPAFVNTLNGSSLAVGRTIAAILENYWMADGEVGIPAVLQTAMSRVVLGGHA